MGSATPAHDIGQHRMTSQTTKRQRALVGDGSDIPSPQKYTERDGDVRGQKIRLAKRARIGADWDGKADNDNIAWPLATALIREGNTELLKAAFAYRRIHDMAKSEAVIGGKSAALGEGMSLDRHTHVRPNGTIAYKHVRQSEAASVDIPATRKVPPYEDEAAGVQRNSTKVPRPWQGDKPVNDMIDAKRQLERLRQRLGPLVEPLEMSVIDGATYREVGNAAGIANKAGSEGAGRALVHTALLSVRDALGHVTRSDLAA